MLEGSTFIYLHNDHLGSPALTTSGTISSTLKFYAYGKPRSSSGTQPTRYQFTGQYQDDSGLTFMNARYYDPSIGTFISADTIVPSPGAAVAYNRYAYANLNPMNLVDPSGHDACGSGANPYCDEYQQGLIKSCHSNARECNITYEMFLAAMQQYVLYALNPDQYFIDVLIETGQIEGSSSDRAAASQRTAYAILYSQNFLNLEIEIAIERESNGLGPVTTALDKSPNSGLGAVASGVIGGGAYWKLKPSGALRALYVPI